MAVTFHQPSVYALFDAIPAPLLTFSVSGLVTYANPWAKQHPGRPVESMSGNPVIKSLVASATLGKLKLPYAAKVELADGHQIQGHFMPGPAGLDIAFLATPLDGADVTVGVHPAPVKLRHVIELLRNELVPPLSLVQQQLPRPNQKPDPLQLACKALQDRILRWVDLVEVFGNEVLKADDRIETLALIESVCSELKPRATQMGVHFELHPPEQTLPPLYGNEHLVRRAFVECLENAMVHSRKKEGAGRELAVDIRLTFSGEHVLLALRNRGTSTLKVHSLEVVRPFAGTSSGVEAAPRLGLPLVQRIVSLHGGSMRMSNVDDDTVQVLLEFPTGAPVHGQDNMDMTQAQRYAKDLAQLVSRRRKEKA